MKSLNTLESIRRGGERYLRSANVGSFAKKWRETYVADFVCERLRLNAESRALELGCRQGTNVLELSRRTSAQVVGVDSDRSLILEAIERRSREGKDANVQFLVESPERLPFAQSTFDVVFCDRLLNAVDDPERVASDMIEMTKPDGSVVIVDLYQRLERIGCDAALKAWLGDRYKMSALIDTIPLFEKKGMRLSHFEISDDRLTEEIESMIWGSLGERNDCPTLSWGNPISWRSGWALLEAIDRREIGYAAMVYRRNR